MKLKFRLNQAQFWLWVITQGSMWVGFTCLFMHRYEIVAFARFIIGQFSCWLLYFVASVTIVRTVRKDR